MENLFEPEGQTTSDNFLLSEETNETVQPHPQSCWGEMSADDISYLDKKGMKTPVELLKSYRALEKAYSSKISLPKDGDENALKKFYTRLGMPENSADFKLSLTKEDEPFGEAFKSACLKNHILPKSAQALYDWFCQHRLEQMSELEQNRQTQSFADMEEMKSEWGAKADQNLELMKRGVRLFTGEDNPDAVDAIEQALGTKQMMKIFCKLGEAVSEDNPVAFGVNSRALEQPDMAAYFKEMFHGL